MRKMKFLARRRGKYCAELATISSASQYVEQRYTLPKADSYFFQEEAVVREYLLAPPCSSLEDCFSLLIPGTRRISIAFFIASVAYSSSSPQRHSPAFE